MSRFLLAFKTILSGVHQSKVILFDEIDSGSDYVDLLHNRIIPGEIQREVYERDHGKCTKCGSKENLHFDHILPYSKGGSSKVVSNIQLLCAKHNLQKGAKFT